MVSDTSSKVANQRLCWLTLTALATCILFGLAGCPTVVKRRIALDESYSDIVLYDKYRLRFSASASGSNEFFGFWCEVNFVERVKSDVDFDSIPIFLIDSVCFSGECLDSFYCHEPLNDYEASKILAETYGPGYLVPGRPNLSDINWDDDFVWPSDFHFADTQDVRIPLSCNGEKINLTVYTRLLDRPTNSVLNQAVRTIPYVVESFETLRDKF